MKNEKAFTLVELIVVIIILAILGTIAFIALQGYSKDARDSARISDLSSIKSSLEYFQLDAGKYPSPTNGVNITYSGGTVWSQGTFGDTVFTNVSKLDKIPVDPTTDKEYTYSITQNKNSFQLGGIIEGDSISLNYNISNSSYAGNTIATAYVTGNYNGLMTKSNSGELCNIIAVPSIITNDTSVTDLTQIAASGSFVYRGYKNLPGSFKDSKYKFDGGFNFKPNNLVAYTDTGSCTSLTQNTASGITARINLIQGIQNIYTGSLVKNDGEIKNILALNIDVNTPSNEVKNYAGYLVNNNLGGSIGTSTASNNSGTNTSLLYKYRINYTNSDYFTTNSASTFNNGLKLTQNQGGNLCLGKTVTCNSGVTFCSNSCTGAGSPYTSATYDGGQTGTTWIKYDLVTPAIADNLSIFSYYQSGYEAVKDFEIYGSNDDASYTKLGTGTHLNDTTSTYINYTFSNTNAYRYYRFDILSHYPGNGGNNRMLEDLKLLGSPFYSTTPSTTQTLSGNTMSFSSLGVTSIQNINISDTLTTGTNAKYLISFDGKTSWKYYNGTSWVTAAGGLNDIETLGMTSTYINTLTSDNFTGLENQTSIDFAVSLSTTNTANTPVINYIDVSYYTSESGSQYQTCKQILDSLPSSTSGVYNVYPDFKYKKSVYCDMVTDGGGWTLITNATTTNPNLNTLGNSLTGDFTAGVVNGKMFTQNSTETRYSCKTNTVEIDLKTSFADIRNRQYQTGLRCTDGFFYTISSVGSYFTGIGNNNYTPAGNGNYISCADYTGHDMGVMGIGLSYNHWLIYDIPSSSWSMKCGGTSTATEYMRVRVR